MMLDLLIVLMAACAMEGVAWFSHKFLMHGVGWVWHASHHRPRTGRFEANDLFAVGFAAVAISLIWFGTRGMWPLQWIGAGMTLYGAMYALVHDCVVHRRWNSRIDLPGGYVRRLVRAHRLHHSNRDRTDAVCLGFLLAPSDRRLQEVSRSIRSRNAGLK